MVFDGMGGHEVYGNCRDVLTNYSDVESTSIHQSRIYLCVCLDHVLCCVLYLWVIGVQCGCVRGCESDV